MVKDHQISEAQRTSASSIRRGRARRKWPSGAPEVTRPSDGGHQQSSGSHGLRL